MLVSFIFKVLQKPGPHCRDYVRILFREVLRVGWIGFGVKEQLAPVRGEIVTAAERAKSYGFDYIACKPFLTRAERNNAEIVDLRELDHHFDEITARIRAAIDEAKKLEDDSFRIYETTNLKVLENRSH